MERIRAAQITSKALKARNKYMGLGAHTPICPYSLCEAMSFDLRFVKIASFEGMYVANENLVLISSERAEGRKRFTCAHEVGHHELGHGTVIDEIIDHGSNRQEEQEADLFAGMLLMPSSAVQRALTRYRVTEERLKNTDAYILSKYFGVSYKAFIFHIYENLHLISYKHYQSLKNARLGDLRESISGIKTKNQVFSIGAWWDEKAIEMEIGDIIVSEKALSTDGPTIIKEVTKDASRHVYEAVSPGITRIYSDDWSCFSKISRHKFQGFFQYKYDEEEE